MAEKTELSIVLRTVDKATAKLNAINARLEAITKPFRDFKKALGEVRENSGLDDVIGGFKGVGSAITDLLGKLLMIGGVAGAATAALMSIIDGFDDLGDKAEAAGVSVDFLAQMRYAAKKSGASVEALDAGLQNFSKSLGLARANSGPLVKFLGTVSPALLKQVKAAKSNEEAFNLLANAMAKIKDPAKRAAFAQKTLGDATLAPLLAKGGKGIKELRDEHFELAGSQEEAAAAAGEFGDEMDKLHATTDGIKAALVTGLAPALKVIVERLRDWFGEHREDVKLWAMELGKRLPGAVANLARVVKSAIGGVLSFVDAIGGWKVAAVALAAIMAGPLLQAIVAFGVALLTTPVGWIVGGIAAIAAAAYLLIDNWEAVSTFFTDLWDTLGEKFGWGREVIMLALAPIIGAASLILASWGKIKGFFVDLWDGVTEAFRAAIDFIIDKIEWVVQKIEDIRDYFDSEDAEASELEAASAALPAALVAGQGEAANERLLRARQAYEQSRLGNTVNRIIVDFANTPRGTRVNADPANDSDVDLSVGYQLLGLTP